MNTDEQDVRYVKPSAKVTPKKADHEHEYIRVIAWQYVKYKDGSVSTWKHKFSLPAECVTCGHKRRRMVEAVEVAVTWDEFNKIKKEKMK